MKSLLLLPFIALGLLVLVPFALLLFFVATALFSPIFATIGIAQLPSKFYEYVK